MSADPHIVLIGPTEAGGSSIGRVLAGRLDRTLSDCACWIEDRVDLGASSWDPDALECAHLFEATASPEPLIIVAGAAMVLDRDARAVLASPACFTVWLDADPEWLAARVPGSGRVDLGARFVRLDAQRHALYAAVADLTLLVDELGDVGNEGAALIGEAYGTR